MAARRAGQAAATRQSDQPAVWGRKAEGGAGAGAGAGRGGGVRTSVTLVGCYAAAELCPPPFRWKNPMLQHRGWMRSAPSSGNAVLIPVRYLLAELMVPV